MDYVLVCLYKLPGLAELAVQQAKIFRFKSSGLMSFDMMYF